MSAPEQPPADPFDFDHPDAGGAAERREERAAGAWVYVAAIGSVLALALAVEVYGAGRLLRAQVIPSWPTAEGVILSSELEWQWVQRQFSGHVRYRYRVDGKAYESQKVNAWGGIADGDRSEVEEALERYPVGAAVPVMYNPDDPAEGYLEGGVNPVAYLGLAVPPLFAGAVVWVLWSRLRARARLLSRADERDTGLP